MALLPIQRHPLRPERSGSRFWTGLAALTNGRGADRRDSAAATVLTGYARPAAPTLRNVQEAAAEGRLAAGQVWQLTGDQRWRVVTCVQGEIWITQAGDARDYVLSAGDMVLITRPGTVVIQALQEARFQLTPPLRTAPYHGGQTVFP